MSPKNRYSFLCFLFVSFLLSDLSDAPTKTSRGKMAITTITSYIPLIHVVYSLPTYGMESSMMMASDAFQNAPLICAGLNVRESSMPAEKENMTRSDPPSRLLSSSDQPTPRLP